MIPDSKKLGGSFRDPSGFVFSQEKIFYRAVRQVYREHYQYLIHSGLYDSLLQEGLLIPHKEVSHREFEWAGKTEEIYKILKPEEIPFISYPYEWCFSQLKDAALVTLQIQKKAMKFGMTLKDANATNIQFLRGKPVLIDTLSFEKYEEGLPWVAYRQFCQHFLAPLALMSIRHIELHRLLQVYIDGIPLDLVCSLLPLRSYFRLGLFLHLYLHGRAQKRYEDKMIKKAEIPRTFSRYRFEALLDNLETTISKLKYHPESKWVNYYRKGDCYTEESLEHKKKLVIEYLELLSPKSLWDLGANVGIFSRLASRKGIFTLSLDNDPACVELNYRMVVQEKETNLLPLLVDLTNPSPGLGWEYKERLSLMERGSTDTILALALVHHLAISNNLPFEYIASFFSKICNILIIEFVPKSDPQVQRLLRSRDDIFSGYTQENFESTFLRYFSLLKVEKIKDSQRTLYLMAKKETI